MQDTLDKFMKNYIAVVDLETTGLNPEEGSIVEIGIVRLDLDSGEIDKLFDLVVKERRFSDRDRFTWVFNNTDITFEQVYNAPLLENYLDELNCIFKTYPATAFNKEFDFKFLYAAGIKIIIELPCPMIEATGILKLPPKKPNTLYKWPSVEECWRYYFPSKRYTETHRAYDDAYHEAQIVYEMYKRKQWYPIKNL